jgi:hypothetical protein
MLRKVKMLTALSAVGASAALLMSSQQAFATTAQGSANNPQADVVGVGSDTLQYAGDFLADGSPTTSGYNAAGNKFRMINYDATGDALGRALYNADGTQFFTDSPTTAVVLRAKQKPVEDPDGSGAGRTALLNDSPNSGTNYDGVANGSIQYARSSSMISAANEQTCTTNSTGCGKLHPVAIGTDTMEIAFDASGTSDAVPLSYTQLAKIYECATGFTTWTSVGGTSSDAIIPVIPQLNSGTRNDFITQITSLGGFNGTLGPCVKTAQEHDPNGILTQANPEAAIEPFSLARVNLINSGYFANANEAPNQVALLSTGTPSDGGARFNYTRNMYIVMREVDVENGTGWQPGGTLNWADTLFVGSNSFLAKPTGQATVAAAGFIGGYIDCGAGDTNQPACPAAS